MCVNSIICFGFLRSRDIRKNATLPSKKFWTIFCALRAWLWYSVFELVVVILKVSNRPPYLYGKRLFRATPAANRLWVFILRHGISFDRTYVIAEVGFHFPPTWSMIFSPNTPALQSHIAVGKIKAKLACRTDQQTMQKFKSNLSRDCFTILIIVFQTKNFTGAFIRKIFY